MNLVLFEPAEIGAPLPLADPRAQHILKVLRRVPGDTFVAGVVDGPLGAATLRAVDSHTGALAFDFAPTHEPPPLPPITLLVGLPRPQTARDLLRDTATLGASRIHFIATERADPNYAASTLWTSGEWRRHLLAGAAQACDTRLPAVTWTRSLRSDFPALRNPFGYAMPETGSSSPRPLLLALDNYEASTSLAAALATASRDLRPPSSVFPAAALPPPDAPASPIVLALGPERGWGPADRATLRAAGFTLCSLGPRVLRLETATVAALSLVLHGTNDRG